MSYGHAHLAFGCGLLRAYGKILGFLERAAESLERVLQPTNLPGRVSALGGADSSVQLVSPEESEEGYALTRRRKGKCQRNAWPGWAVVLRMHAFDKLQPTCLPPPLFGNTSAAARRCQPHLMVDDLMVLVAPSDAATTRSMAPTAYLPISSSLAAWRNCST